MPVTTSTTVYIFMNNSLAELGWVGKALSVTTMDEASSLVGKSPSVKTATMTAVCVFMNKAELGW